MDWLKKKSEEYHEMSRKEELSRIKKTIQQSSSTGDFTTSSTQSAVSCVHTVLAAHSSLNGRYRQAQRDIRAQERAKLEALEEVRRKEEQIAQERRDHQNQIKALEKIHSEHFQGLQICHEEENQKNQLIINDLKQNLFGRKEQVTGLADRDLIGRFKAISKSIEQFSRIDWDPSCESGWPYSESELSSLHSRNTRRLKQQIVQNCVWLLLHESVFRTPFRIIGEYGRDFDSPLYEAGSLAFDALGPSKAADYNKKRYMNAEVFLNALRSTDSKSPKDVATLQSYNTARQTAVSSLCSVLRNITTVDLHDKEELDQIWKAAVDFWLEACSQRYRFFVIMPGNGVDILSTGPKSMSLQLITKPELQRFGNLTGSDLEQGEILAGWHGEVEMYC